MQINYNFHWICNWNSQWFNLGSTFGSHITFYIPCTKESNLYINNVQKLAEDYRCFFNTKYTCLTSYKYCRMRCSIFQPVSSSKEQTSPQYMSLPWHSRYQLIHCSWSEMVMLVILHNRGRTAKRLCVTNVTGLLLESFVVFFTLC